MTMKYRDAKMGNLRDKIDGQADKELKEVAKEKEVKVKKVTEEGDEKRVHTKVKTL